MSDIDPQFLAALHDASVFAPELPETDAFDTLDQIRAYEQDLILPRGTRRRPLVLADYADGAAREPDELALFNTHREGVLASADHATDPVRKATGVREGADHGTAGLVRLLVEREATTAIIPVGKQTGNAAVTPDHPVKQAMDLLLPDRQGFLSVHGMRPSKLTSIQDATEIHAIIGLGKQPSERSRQAAERLILAARDLGLRAVIGNDVRYQTYDEAADDVERGADGEPKLGRLAALGAESTTNHAYRVMERANLDVPAFQVEMTRLLRLLPEDMEGGWHRDEKARAMGVHLGYTLMQAAVDIMSTEI